MGENRGGWCVKKEEEKLTSKQLLARSLGKHGYIRQGVHALRIIDRQGPVHEEARDGVFVVHDVVVVLGGAVDGRGPRAVFVHLVILAVVRVGAHGGEEGVAGGASLSVYVRVAGKERKGKEREGALTVGPSWLGMPHPR